MSDVYIQKWDRGDSFVVCKGEEDASAGEGVQDVSIYAMSPRADGRVILRQQGEERLYVCTGESFPFRDGDVFYIRADGKIRREYSRGQAEIDLFITGKCNSNCLMCPLPASARRRSNQGQYEWLKAYVAALPSDVPYINITGGEPTLEKEHFLDVLRRVKAKFPCADFQLLTNGRSLADGHLLDAVLECAPSHMRFAIPLHAGRKSIHDGITQSPGSFEETCEAIRRLLAFRQKVEIRIVLSRLSVPYIEETAKYIAQNFRGVISVNFMAMEMMGAAAQNREMLWEDYRLIFQKIKKSLVYLICHGIDTQLYNFPLCALDRGFWPIAKRSITASKIRYKEACAVCSVRDMCGGFFYSTLALMDPDVEVIRLL